MKILIKKILIFSFILAVLSLTAKAQSLDFPKHPNSELVGQKKQSIAGKDSMIYHYRSILPMERIVSFYDEILSGQGWQRQEQLLPPGKTNFIHVFAKGNKLLLLQFLISQDKGIISYQISVNSAFEDEKDCPSCLAKQPKEPEKVSFVPAYPQAAQLHFKKTPSRTYAVYKTSDNLESIEQFYLKKMPLSGWQLSDSLTKEGTASNIDVVTRDLEFRKENKSCKISISRALGSTSQKRGDIIIAISYYESK